MEVEAEVVEVESHRYQKQKEVLVAKSKKKRDFLHSELKIVPQQLLKELGLKVLKSHPYPVDQLLQEEMVLNQQYPTSLVHPQKS